MKSIIFLTAVCLFTLLSCNGNVNNSTNDPLKNNEIMEATKEQREGIEKAIEYYMEGGRQADGTITARAFTEKATVSWAEDGKVVTVPVQTLCDLMSSGEPASASYEFVSLDVQEDIAITHIKSQFGEAKYYDMFSLVKEGEQWKIVAKIYRNR